MGKIAKIYGVGQALYDLLPPPTFFENAPTQIQDNYSIGQIVYTGTTGAYTFYIYNGAGVWTEIVSALGDVLSVVGTAAQIAATPSSGTGNVVLSLIGPYTPATYTLDGVLYGNAAGSIGATAAGTNGQLLTANTGVAPTWTTASFPSTTTANDILYSSATNTVGQISTANSGVLITSSTGVPSITTSTNGQVLLGSTSGSPAFGTLTTSTGVNFTTGSASLAIDLKQGGYKINSASTGGTVVVQNSYVVAQSMQTSFALPATAAVGDMFVIASATGNTSGWIITQAASQEIWANSSHTTNGATGTLAGAIHCSVVLMCTVANLEFTVVGGSGLTGLTFT
jgi:hypothetical protein